MGDRTKLQIAADQRSRATRRAIGAELRQTREDQGLPQAAVSRAAGIDRAHLCRIEAGDSAASLDVMARIATALGGELSLKFFAGTGPRIRDHLQAAIAEALLGDLHPRWRRFLEVAVYRPVRGVIDMVLDDRTTLVATEVQSELRRLEQQIRWSQEKAAALPSSDLYRFASDSETQPALSRLLVLRSTVATRDLARRFPETLSSAYPARCRDVLDALTGDAAWPGPGIVWARVEGGRAQLLAGPPRGVTLGR